MKVGDNNGTLVSFEVIDVIGGASSDVLEGWCSNVYLVREKSCNREIVIKEINFYSIIEDKYKEAIVLNKLKNNNVVPMHYAGESTSNLDGGQDLVFIAMPFYKNGSLAKKIKNEFNLLKFENKICYSLGMLYGIHGIHVKGYVHLDIKLENLLISDSNEVLLADFGLSRLAARNSELNIDVSLVQLPPELAKIDQSEISLESLCLTQIDIYQAGLCLYQIFCGFGLPSFNYNIEELPQKEQYKMILDGTIVDEAKMNGIDADLTKIIKKCLHKDPKKRFSSIMEIIESLNSLHKGEKNVKSRQKKSSQE